MERGSESTVARAGEAVTIRTDGSIHRTIVRRDDPTWRWILDTAPMPEIEGLTLHEFLEWIAREEGRALEFENRDIEQLSKTTILHGSVAELSLDAALQTVAMSAGMKCEAREGKLVVSSLN
jgi:hypothetical protein